MSFRKRNVAIASSAGANPTSQTSSRAAVTHPGCRPSTIDGRPVTSTGTAALDGLLAGHGGLALGCSLLIGESGTTDYAGALIKFYAAEGLLQGHQVHVVGFPEQWGRELPGVVQDKPGSKAIPEGDRLKIAWRYEALGQFGTAAGGRGRLCHPSQ
jgi:elongator complex protein 4